MAMDKFDVKRIWFFGRLQTWCGDEAKSGDGLHSQDHQLKLMSGRVMDCVQLKWNFIAQSMGVTTHTASASFFSRLVTSSMRSQVQLAILSSQVPHSRISTSQFSHRCMQLLKLEVVHVQAIWHMWIMPCGHAANQTAAYSLTFILFIWHSLTD